MTKTCKDPNFALKRLSFALFLFHPSSPSLESPVFPSPRSLFPPSVPTFHFPLSHYSILLRVNGATRDIYQLFLLPEV